MQNQQITPVDIRKAQITSAGIRKALKKYEYPSAIAEYIWNGFDAKATQLDISFTCNVIGTISSLKITDNGCGISDSTKFQPFFESEKEIDPNAPRVSSTVHGKNGVGRLTFFTFATSATWETIYERGGRRYKYNIDVDSNALDDFRVSEESETTELKGTKVYFHGIHTITADNFETDIKEFLCREFGWVLELNLDKKFSISINGTKLDYRSSIVDELETTQYNIRGKSFDVKFIRWKKSLNREFSRCYFIDSKGDEQYTDTTTLNNKGDHFYHSVFIKSSFFDDGSVSSYDSTIFRNTEEGKTHKEFRVNASKTVQERV